MSARISFSLQQIVANFVDTVQFNYVGVVINNEMYEKVCTSSYYRLLANKFAHHLENIMINKASVLDEMLYLPLSPPPRN